MNKIPIAPRSPLFVIGFPRSGTTILRSMLGNHSKIHLLNNENIIQAIIKAGYNFKTCFDLSKKKRVLDYCKKPYFDTIDKSIVDEIFFSRKIFTFGELYSCLLAGNSGEFIWGSKTHHNILYVEDLLNIYPNAIFVTIIRDARAVCLSKLIKDKADSAGRKPTVNFVGKDISFSESWKFFYKHSLKWSNWNHRVLSLSERIDPDKLLVIKFEDLILNPHKTICHICSKIGLPVENSMFDAQIRKKDPILSSNRSYAHIKIGEELDISRIQSWKILEKRIIWIIEANANQIMKRMGYELDRPIIDPLQLVYIKLIIYRYKIYNHLRTQKNI